MEKRTILEELNIELNGPKKLVFGDPCYREAVKSNTMEKRTYNSLVFSKNFKEPFENAVCKIIKSKVECEYKGMELDYTEIVVSIVMSNDLYLINAINDGMRYEHQKSERKEYRSRHCKNRYGN